MKITLKMMDGSVGKKENYTNISRPVFHILGMFNNF